MGRGLPVGRGGHAGAWQVWGAPGTSVPPPLTVLRLNLYKDVLLVQFLLFWSDFKSLS